MDCGNVPMSGQMPLISVILMPTTCTLLKRPPQSTFEAASWLSFDEFCLALMFILDKTH